MTDPEPHAHPLVPRYSSDLFRGTAEHYARHRPAYPPVLVDAILQRAALRPEDRLLDLACGTGEVSFAFLDAVREILAVDAEPDMVEAGRQRAAAVGVTSITWTVARAEDLDLPDGAFGMVATGRAFHRLDRPRIARKALRWLRAGGCFVDLGIDTSGFSAPSEPWLSRAAEVYERWLPRARRRREDGRSAPDAAQPRATTEQVLAGAGFLDVEKMELDVPHTWTVEGFVGYLYSTSYSSQEFWGDAREGFENDLRSALLDVAPSGLLHETLSAYCVVGHAPSAAHNRPQHHR